MIHETADVSPEANIGEGTKIWNWVQVREGAKIGADCVLSKGVYIDRDVTVGNKVKIQNNVSVYKGVTIEDGVFVGPHVCFTNDKYPRAVNADFELAGESDWEVSPITIKKGASIGANATVLPGVTIGEFAVVGAGAVVTKDVDSFTKVLGNPAKFVGKVDENGRS